MIKMPSLEFELANNNVAVQHVSLYPMWITHLIKWQKWINNNGDNECENNPDEQYEISVRFILLDTIFPPPPQPPHTHTSEAQFLSSKKPS